MDDADIWATAYKHGVTEGDIRHALRNRVKTILTENELVMIIGPTHNATMLEIGIGRSSTPCPPDANTGPNRR